MLYIVVCAVYTSHTSLHTIHLTPFTAYTSLRTPHCTHPSLHTPHYSHHCTHLTVHTSCTYLTAHTSLHTPLTAHTPHCTHPSLHTPFTTHTLHYTRYLRSHNSSYCHPTCSDIKDFIGPNLQAYKEPQNDDTMQINRQN